MGAETGAGGERGVRRSSLWVLGVTAAVYLLTFEARQDGVILGNDVIPFSRSLAAGESHGLINPHHLLAHPLAWVFGRLGALPGGGGFDLGAALLGHRMLSALGGAAAVAVLLRFACRVAPRGIALGLTAAFALTSGTWLYAAVGETYLPAYAATGALLVRAAEDRLGLRPAGPLALGSWLLLAVLLRQDSVLVVPALLVLARPRAALLAIAGAGALALALYLVAFLLAGPEAAFVPWLKGLAETGAWGRTPGWPELGIAVGVTAAAVAYGVWFVQFGLSWKAVLGLGGLALLLAGCTPLRPPAGAAARAVLALALFVVVRFAFLAWWQPSNMEYQAGSVLPLFLAVAILLREARAPRVRAALLAAAAAVIGLGNAAVLIAPARGEVMAEAAAAAIGAAGPDGLVLSIDHLQHYAVLREQPACETLDAQDLAVGYGPDPTPRLQGQLQHLLSRREAALDRGAPVVVTYDRWFQPYFYRVEPTVRAEFVAALTAGLEQEEVRDASGQVLMLVLRR